MTAARLTDAERRELIAAWPWPQEAATTRDGLGAVARVVEHIIGARLLSQDEFHARLHRGILSQARREATNDFLQYVTSNGAYNGSDDPQGQRFYDECLNPWLAGMASQFFAEADR